MSCHDEEERLAADDTIGNTVTSKDIATVAQRVTNDPSVEVLEYHFNAYSANKLGYLGSHRSLRITIQRSITDEIEVLNLFVKSVPYDCQKQAEFVNQDGVFGKESAFYETLAPLLIQNYKGQKWLPTCYLAKKDSLIVEDLRSQGYKTLGMFFDEYAPLKSALATLARFHSCSILEEARLSQELKTRITLKERYPDCLNEVFYSTTSRLGHWVAAGINLVVVLAKRFGYDDCKLREGCARIYELVKSSKTHFNTICHGDLWTNNIMFDDSKPLPKSILVDYQVFKYAPMVLDLLQMLYLNSSPRFRKQEEIHLIRYYYSVLRETVNNNDSTKNMVLPTLEKILADYEDLRLFGAITASLYLPFVLLDPKLSTERMKDSDGFDHIMFGDRIDITLSCLAKDEFYRNKVEEVVAELAEITQRL